MFGFYTENMAIEALEEYFKVHDIFYSDKYPLISDEFKKFDKYYQECSVKHSLGKPGYEKYSDEYIFNKRIELLKQLFIKFFSLHDVARLLKDTQKRYEKKIFIDAGMTLGKDKHELSPREILENERVGRPYLENIKIKNEVKEIQRRR